MFFSISHSLTIVTFLGFMRILFGLIIYPRNSTFYIQKQHFSSSTSSFASYSIFSILYTYCLYFSFISEKISILSRQYIAKSSRYSLSIQLIIHWNTASAFVSPNSMTLYSNSPNLIWKAVFHLSPFLIRIRLQAPLRLIKVNHFLPQSRSRNSVISGKGVQSLIEISFNYQQSITSLSLLFFLGTNIMEYLANNLNIRIYPFLSISSIYSFKALSSISLRLYIE